MKNFDENKVLRGLSKIARINSNSKWIEINRGELIGVKRLAQIDYLTHYCGYKLSYGGRIAVGDKFENDDDEKKVKTKYQKKDAKSHKLSDKRKRQ